MGSIPPCFWDRDPPLWLVGPWPACPPPVNTNPTVPRSSLSPDRRPPLLGGVAGSWDTCQPSAPLPLLQPLGWGGGQDPTCSFINKGRDCSWEEAGCVFSHTSPLTLTRVQGRLTEAQGPEVVRAPPGGHPRAGPQWHTQAAPGAPAWASETEDRETRRNSFSPWAVNDTDSRGGWESGEGSKGSEDRGCSRVRAVCGWTPSGWTTSQGDGGRKVLGGGGTFHSAL